MPESKQEGTLARLQKAWGDLFKSNSELKSSSHKYAVQGQDAKAPAASSPQAPQKLSSGKFTDVSKISNEKEVKPQLESVLFNGKGFVLNFKNLHDKDAQIQQLNEQYKDFYKDQYPDNNKLNTLQVEFSKNAKNQIVINAKHLLKGEGDKVIEKPVSSDEVRGVLSGGVMKKISQDYGEPLMLKKKQVFKLNQNLDENLQEKSAPQKPIPEVPKDKSFEGVQLKDAKVSSSFRQPRIYLSVRDKNGNKMPAEILQGIADKMNTLFGVDKGSFKVSKNGSLYLEGNVPKTSNEEQIKQLGEKLKQASQQLKEPLANPIDLSQKMSQAKEKVNYKNMRVERKGDQIELKTVLGKSKEKANSNQAENIAKKLNDRYGNGEQKFVVTDKEGKVSVGLKDAKGDKNEQAKLLNKAANFLQTKTGQAPKAEAKQTISMRMGK